MVVDDLLLLFFLPLFFLPLDLGVVEVDFEDWVEVDLVVVEEAGAVCAIAATAKRAVKPKTKIDFFICYFVFCLTRLAS